jgi:hypothetical protein
MAAMYRVRQFVRAVGAWVRRDDTEQVRSYLPLPAVELFRSMPRYDQQHALNVLHMLEEQGHAEPALLVAALLHDTGKTVQQSGALRLWHRVAVVLLRAFWPDALERLGRNGAEGWRRPFYVQQHHAALGAELAREAGCSQLAVDLILHHEKPLDEADAPLLAALKSADNAN